MISRMHKRRGTKPDEIVLTPMIDVVFQLLVYFVFTFEPIDVFAHLSVFRPSEDKGPIEGPEIELVKIAIFPNGGFSINGKNVNQEQMETMLLSLAELNPNQTVVITCMSASLHQHLVELLDLCAKANLTNLSVTSR